jgi:mycofactocin precursor
MDDTATIDATATDDHAHDADADAELLEDELLVEEISIDGMCGVY